MAGALLSENDRKAELPFAFLSALSYYAGFTCSRGPDPDRYCIDAVIRSGGSGKPQIDVQLKATSATTPLDDGLHFQLDKDYYNVLRETPRICPIILAVLELPENIDDWLYCYFENLVMRRRAWWVCLAGREEIDTGSKTVVLPRSQFLTPESLTTIMSQAGPSAYLGGAAQ